MRLDRRQVGSFGAYAAAASLSIVAAIWVLHLWRANLRVPFDYDDDALLFGFIVRTVVDRGWLWTNPMGGAPAGFDLHDYPVSAHDTTHLAIVRMMALGTHDWGLVFNLYFLLGFPLIAIAALAVFRRFGVGTVPAVAVSVLYAFLPSRLLVGEIHLFLDVFFQVPIAVLLMLRVCAPDPPLVAPAAPGARWPRLDLRSGRTWAALGGAALVSATSSYYAFFAICLLVGIGVWAAVERRSWRNFAAGLALAGVVAAGLFLQGLPTIVYQAGHGPNPQVGKRFAWEAEVYGLKLAPLLLPVTGHRVPPLARVKSEYDAAAPLNSETGVTSLGVVAAVGFLSLLGVALAGRRAPGVPAPAPSVDRSAALPPEAPLRPLAVLTVLAILLGTIGGFGSLFALLVSPQIRAYCRLNVFIGFFALFAVALLLERVRRRRPRVAAIATLAAFAIGLLDQTSSLAVRDYAGVERVFASDAAFVRRIEAVVPSGAALFQLPASTFPEPPSVNRMAGYAPFRPLLHARTTRWSYPAMRGRATATWVADVAARPPARMLEAVSDAGFEGVVIDRDGYADGGAALASGFRELLGGEPLPSSDGRLRFFSLTEYSRRRRARESPAAEALPR